MLNQRRLQRVLPAVYKVVSRSVFHAVELGRIGNNIKINQSRSIILQVVLHILLLLNDIKVTARQIGLCVRSRQLLRLIGRHLRLYCALRSGIPLDLLIPLLNDFLLNLERSIQLAQLVK